MLTVSWILVVYELGYEEDTLSDVMMCDIILCHVCVTSSDILMRDII